MQEADIIEAIRRGIREPRAVTVSDTQISAVILRGVTLVGLKIRQTDPSFFNERKSVSSYTNVFSKPSDCLTIEKIWDLGTTAKSITGAADNGSGAIRITSATHGFSDEAKVLVHDVGGCTEANGTWQIDYVDANTFDLLGSTFSNAYTSGGTVFVEPSDPDEITKIELSEATLSQTDKWYPRKDKIVIDDNSFTNDIILDYIAMPDAIADIDAAFHDWLVSFGIVDLMSLPEDQGTLEFQDKVKTLQVHQGRLSMIDKLIEQTYQASSEPSYVKNVWGNDG